MKITMDVLSADEKHDFYCFYVLDKIQELLNNSESQNNKVIYNVYLYPAHNDQHKPNSFEEQIIIRKLIAEGVVEKTESDGNFQINPREDGNPDSAGIFFNLVVDIKKFEKLYKCYKNIMSSQTQERGLLVFSISTGKIEFTDKNGFKYFVELTPGTNSYEALKMLISNPTKLFSFDEIANTFKKRNELLTERRVRDAIGYIKRGLKYKGSELFETNGGFRLKCRVQID